MQPVKRFIAGVVCPKCGASDSVRAWLDEAAELQHRDCVDCGYEDSLSTKVQVNPPSELTTRVTPVSASEPTPAQPINILDPGLRRTDH
ncbi:YheV family putative zinc ribbon protein [Salinibius halmophilus]|uniref:YheV family putative zinc ribbon protein n=1 Tax=Salinibius halmophilus TaxID=1853216 RepID=UPI000E6702E8|nr:YheV family putative zinc ribbon protein [Salinibius halmophilus]